MALSAILILSSVSAFFTSEREQTLREELQTVARSLASFIDNVMKLSGVATFDIGPDVGADLLLPGKIGGNHYDFELRQDSAIFSLDGRTAMARWTGSLHFWRWEGIQLDDALVRELDEGSRSLILSSWQSFELVIDVACMAGAEVPIAFAFPR